jgi:hypothetical protein
MCDLRDGFGMNDKWWTVQIFMYLLFEFKRKFVFASLECLGAPRIR